MSNLTEQEKRERLFIARKLAKEGDTDNAGELLRQLLRDDPQNAEAWALLSGVLETPERRREAIQRALAIAPDNFVVREAQRALDAELNLAPTRTAPQSAGGGRGGSRLLLYAVGAFLVALVVLVALALGGVINPPATQTPVPTVTTDASTVPQAATQDITQDATQDTPQAAATPTLDIATASPAVPPAGASNTPQPLPPLPMPPGLRQTVQAATDIAATLTATNATKTP